MPDADITRRIAWDGLEFETPADWELSDHHFHRKVGSLVLEDSTDVRLQLEWAAGLEAQDRHEHVEQQYRDFAQKTDKVALASRPLAGAPLPWLAHQYVMPGNRGMVSAIHLPEDNPVAVFARIYETTSDHAGMTTQAVHLLRSFQYHAQGLIPWRVYDYDLKVPHDFRLSSAAFYAGRKLMIFEKRFRRLFFWQFSLAQRLLDGEAPVDFAVRFLTRFKGLPGPKFYRDRNGKLAARRKWNHPIGHYEEIGRACFRYLPLVIHDLDRDRLLLMVYHYRRRADLEWIRDVYPSERLADRLAFENNLTPP